MIPVLAPILQGELTYLRDLLFLRGDPAAEALGSAVPAAGLLDDAVLGGVLTRFAQDQPGADWRAVVSLWSQWYFSYLLPGVVTALLSRQHALPMGLDDVDVIIAPAGYPAGFRFAGPGRHVAADDPKADLAAMIREHVQPLVMAFAAIGRAAPRLHGCNAGVRFAWAVRLLEDDPAQPPKITVPGRELLQSRVLPDGTPNPLYAPLRTRADADGGVRHVQRICCLRYLLAGYGLCANCPRDAVASGVLGEGSPG